MRYLVTGATSFIARAVIKKLNRKGHEAISLRHSFEEHKDMLPRSADIWLHFAWGGAGSAGRSDEAVQEANVRMTMAAIDKAVGLNCRRFLFAGSQAEYGFAQNGSFKKEDGPVSPVSAYGKAKLRVLGLAEERLRPGTAGGSGADSMDYIHMRLFSVYGPGDHRGSLIDSLVDSVMAGKELELGSCSQNWDYLYIEDAAEAIVMLSERAGAGTYNVGSGDIRALRDYALAAAAVIREDGGGFLRFGRRGDNAEGSADLSPDLSRIRELGFLPAVSFEEGIERIIKSKGFRRQD